MLGGSGMSNITVGTQEYNVWLACEKGWKKAAIDNVRGRVINDDNCYTDVLWHARVMGPVLEGESQ